MGLERISPVFFESASAVTATNSVALGSRRVDANGYEYVYCFNAGGEQISPGFGAIVSTGTSGFSVTITSVAETAHQFVGVVKHATLTTATYGWVLTKGFSQIEVAANSTVTGAKFMILAADGAFSPVSAAVAVLQPIVVISDADANTASAGSFLGKVVSQF